MYISEWNTVFTIIAISIVIILIQIYVTTITEDTPCSQFRRPRFTPKVWNHRDIRMTNNCYSYAFQDADPTLEDKPQPGEKAGMGSVPKRIYTCSEFKRRILSDKPKGSVVHFSDASGGQNNSHECPCGFHKVFLALDDKGDLKDYHFWRQDSDSTWSSKSGNHHISRKDGSGQKIKDPLTSDKHLGFYTYNTPCFYMCTKTRQDKHM